MTRKNPSLLIFAALAACSAAHARQGNTMQDEFRIYTAEIATQCASVKDLLKTFDVNANPLTGYTLKDAVQSLCVCIPANLTALKATVPAKDMKREVSEQEVLNLFNPGVIDKCAGEQIQAMYGEHCPERFKLADLDVGEYCTCMKSVVSGYSDAETAAIAAAAQDYLPAAAEAEKNGQPTPAKPEILEIYSKADLRCKGMWKGFEGLKP